MEVLKSDIVPELVPISPVTLQNPKFKILPIDENIANPVTVPKMEEQPVGMVMVDEIKEMAPTSDNSLPSRFTLLPIETAPLLATIFPLNIEDAPIDTAPSTTQ